MTDIVISKNNVFIRLTDERWFHIISEHPELHQSRSTIIKTVGEPERILAGSNNEKLAVREVETGKWMVVVYRENEEDGFIITAFLTRRHRSLEKRLVLWSL